MSTFKARTRTAFNYALGIVFGAILTLMLVEMTSPVQTGDRIRRAGPDQVIEVPHPGADQQTTLSTGTWCATKPTTLMATSSDWCTPG